MSYKTLGTSRRKEKKSPRFVSINRDRKSIKTFVSGYKCSSCFWLLEMVRGVSWWISLFLPQNNIQKHKYESHAADRFLIRYEIYVLIFYKIHVALRH